MVSGRVCVGERVGGWVRWRGNSLYFSGISMFNGSVEIFSG